MRVIDKEPPQIVMELTLLFVYEGEIKEFYFNLNKLFWSKSWILMRRSELISMFFYVEPNLRVKMLTEEQHCEAELSNSRISYSCFILVV